MAGLGAIIGRGANTGRAGITGRLIFIPPPPGFIGFIFPMISSVIKNINRLVKLILFHIRLVVI
jgi:hypothetical protein